MSTKRFTLENVLAPITLETFFNDYWEKQPLIISDRSPHHYDPLITLKDVEDLIYYGAQGTNDIKLVKGRQPTYTNYIREKTPATVMAYEAYTAGYTVVVNNLSARHPNIAAFTRALEDVFNSPTKVNSYLTPPDSQGFDAHYDTHDVFILQLTGSKQWFVYDTIPDRLPLEGRSRPITPNELPEKPKYDFTLRTGELLYMPRGVIHYANTTNDSSLHLTVGVHVTRWAEVLTRAITALSRRNVALRESVPPGYLTRQGLTEEMQAHFHELLALVSQQATLKEASDSLSESLIFDYATVPDGHFTQLDRLNQITIDTHLEKRSGAMNRVTGSEHHSTIQFSGNTVRGPRKVAPALAFVATNSSFLVKDLPELKDAEKVVLAKSLVKEGLLRVADNESL
jgi:ribosomal protein L16 Arg81 hydroxylase